MIIAGVMAFTILLSVVCFGGQTSRAATLDVDETDLGLDENAFDEMDMLTEEQAGLSFREVVSYIRNGDLQGLLDYSLKTIQQTLTGAVLTSAQAMRTNLATAKLNREQNRAKSKEALLAIINDETMDSAAKDEAVSSYVKLTDTIEKETDAETVLTAKGYTDCIVTVNDDTVDVTLPVANLSDTERAQVEDIVTRKTGYDVSQLVITVAEDK